MKFADLQIGVLYIMQRNHGVWTVVEYMGGHLFKDYTHRLYEDEMFLRMPNDGVYAEMEILTDEVQHDVLTSTTRWMKETEENLVLAKSQFEKLSKVQL